mmetsp:Transcript_47066/g.142947  ORF Transcript_47066/g.142947 Transcript_47066/m.142947 type:complete len:299 (+) Transcript_47066:654-1550(+)
MGPRPVVLLMRHLRRLRPHHGHRPPCPRVHAGGGGAVGGEATNWRVSPGAGSGRPAGAAFCMTGAGPRPFCTRPPARALPGVVHAHGTGPAPRWRRLRPHPRAPRPPGLTAGPGPGRGTEHQTGAAGEEHRAVGRVDQGGEAWRLFRDQAEGGPGLPLDVRQVHRPAFVTQHRHELVEGVAVNALNLGWVVTGVVFVVFVVVLVVIVFFVILVVVLLHPGSTDAVRRLGPRSWAPSNIGLLPPLRRQRLLRICIPLPWGSPRVCRLHRLELLHRRQRVGARLPTEHQPRSFGEEHCAH